MGSGLGQSFFLEVTLSSGQVEWSASPGSHSFEVHSCEQFRRIVHLEVDVGQNIPRGKTHSFQDTLCLVSEEWPRVGNGLDSYSSRDRLIHSRLHLVWCRRNGLGWGVVQAQQSGTVIPRGQTHSLQATPCLVSEEWPRVGNSPGQSFLRADSFSPGYTLFSVGGMAQGKEWYKHFSRADSFSPGYTLFSVGRIAQGGKWSRFRNQKQSFFLG
jgi:hypothetical protein